MHCSAHVSDLTFLLQLFDATDEYSQFTFIKETPEQRHKFAVTGQGLPFNNWNTAFWLLFHVDPLCIRRLNLTQMSAKQ